MAKEPISRLTLSRRLASPRRKWLDKCQKRSPSENRNTLSSHSRGWISLTDDGETPCGSHIAFGWDQKLLELLRLYQPTGFKDLHPLLCWSLSCCGPFHNCHQVSISSHWAFQIWFHLMSVTIWNWTSSELKESQSTKTSALKLSLSAVSCFQNWQWICSSLRHKHFQMESLTWPSLCHKGQWLFTFSALDDPNSFLIETCSINKSLTSLDCTSFRLMARFNLVKRSVSGKFSLFDGPVESRQIDLSTLRSFGGSECLFSLCSELLFVE